MLLENVRFHKEEEKNDPAFAKELASLAEIYVNDAFGTAHRAHASTAGVADYLPAVCRLPDRQGAGRHGQGAGEPEARPFVAILGGAKVSDKIGVINNLLDKVDTLIIGGGMAYTFHEGAGRHASATPCCEEDKVELASEMMAKAKEKGVQAPAARGQRVRPTSSANDAMRITVALRRDPRRLGWAWTSARRPSELFADDDRKAPAPSSGTARWACSSSRTLPCGTSAVAKAVAESGRRLHHRRRRFRGGG